MNFIQNIHIRFKKEENFSNHNAILSSGGRYIYFSKLYIKIMGLFLKIYLTFWYNVFWVFISCHSLRLSTKKTSDRKSTKKAQKLNYINWYRSSFRKQIDVAKSIPANESIHVLSWYSCRLSKKDELISTNSFTNLNIFLNWY